MRKSEYFVVFTLLILSTIMLLKTMIDDNQYLQLEDILNEALLIAIIFVAFISLFAFLYGYLKYKEFRISRWFSLASLNSFFFIWTLVYFLLYRDKFPRYLFPIFLTFCAISAVIHFGFFQKRLEQSKPYVTDISYLDFEEPIQDKKIYTRKIKLHLTNEKRISISNLEFNVKFEDIKGLKYDVIEFFPSDKRLFYKEEPDTEIYYKWRGIKKNETVFLLFKVSWEKENGYNRFTPIDTSGTYINLGVNVNVKIIKKYEKL